MNTNLVNATPIAVTYRDGKTETITLSVLSIRQRYVYIKHLGANDTPALVALCAGKAVEWIDTLTDASFIALLAESYRLNFTLAMELVKNDPVALHQLGPMLVSLEQLEKTVTLTSGSSGSASSTRPASSASAAETTSVAST